MEPQVQYVRSADSTNLAYTTLGDGIPVIYSPHLWHHLTLWLTGETLEASRLMAAAGLQLVRYDMRGLGLSDRDVKDFSLESQVADIEALRLHLGFDRFAIYGDVFGTLACLSYAHAHSGRLTHLILSVPVVNGEEWYRSSVTLQGLESFREMDDSRWNQYILAHAALYSGSGPRDANLMAQRMRKSTTPATLRTYLAQFRTQNVTRLLGQVRSPTLVICRKGLPSGSRYVEWQRAVARAIPAARLVTVEPHFEMPSLQEARLATEFILGRPVEWSSTEAAPVVLAGPDHEAVRRVEASGTAIILFADIADSTGLTERLGDAAFRAKARELDDALKGVIREHAGTAIEGKLLGDGVLAVFTSARQAIEAALSCARAGNTAELPLHLGLHAGDVIREDNNVYGGAVNIASRISGLSAAGEVLVSDIVRGLARTSAGVRFEDRGEQALKGVGEAVRVWAVRGAE